VSPDGAGLVYFAVAMVFGNGQSRWRSFWRSLLCQRIWFRPRSARARLRATG